MPESPSAPVLPAASPPPTPPVNPPPKGLSSMAKVVIAVVAAAVIVFAVLASGLIPGVSLFGTSSGPATESSASALQEAQGTAQAHGAGSLVLAIGASPTYSFQFGNLKGNSSCPISDGLGKNFTVPAQTGSYSSGNAVFWLFVYYNATVPSESVVAVVGSATYFLGSESGASCVSSAGLTPISAGYISSTSAASVADGKAGWFLSAHAQANAVFVLVENGTAGPAWGVVYTNCSYDAATNQTVGGKAADLFYAEINGTSSNLITSITKPGDLNCSSLLGTVTGQQPYVLEMFSYSHSGSGNTFYDDLDLTPTSGLTTAMFGLSVASGSSAVVPVVAPSSGCVYGASPTACTGSSGGWYGVLVSSISGDVVAAWAVFGSAAAWGDLAPSTSNITVTTTLTLEVVSSSSLAGTGATITVVSTGSAEVSGEASL